MKRNMLSRTQKIKLRILSSAAFFLEEPSATTRSTAKAFDVTKSTTHRDLRERLPEIDPVLASKVAKKLDENLDVRASRGGKATALKRHTH